MKKNCVCLLLLFASVSAFAQPPFLESPQPVFYGVSGGAALDNHTADFRALPGVPNCCPRFGSGQGTGWSISALGEFPLSHSLALDVRAGFTSVGGTLTADETTLLNVNNVLTSGTFRHTVIATLGIVHVSPMIVVRLFDAPLRLQLGARIGIPATATFSQKEEITQPATTGVFADNGMRTRNVVSGALPDVNPLAVSALAGIRYELPMNGGRTLLLAPEIMAEYAFTPVVKDLAWHANALGGGISLMYRPQPDMIPTGPAPPTAPAPEPAAPMPAPVPAPTVSLDAFGISDDGKETSAANIRIEEFVGTKMRPLLPFVFFSENSAALPARYITASAETKASFQETQLHNRTTLDVYRNILNIVGRRLQEHPEAKIALVGCTADRGVERDRSDLAQSRAYAVRNYLHDVWNIDTTRLAIVVHTLPTNPSNPDSSYGMEENRRVEFVGDVRTILGPVTTHDTTRTVTPPVVRFRVMHTAPAGVSRWALRADQHGVSLRDFHGASAVPSIVDWRIDSDVDSLPRSLTAIDAAVSIDDSLLRRVNARARPLPVEQITVQHKREQRVADHTVDEYGLILFNFNKAELGAGNQQLCAMIGEQIPIGSTVRVEGYTDKTGDPAHNRVLSQERASAVAKSLGTLKTTVNGHGDASMVFPNDTPEGRFYCRTVIVRVEAPVMN